MSQMVILDLLVIVGSSVTLSVYLWQALIKHKNPSYDRIFMNGWLLLFGTGHLLSNLKILPSGWVPFIAFPMLLVMVGYGLVLVSRRTAKRNS